MFPASRHNYDALETPNNLIPIKWKSHTNTINKIVYSIYPKDKQLRMSPPAGLPKQFDLRCSPYMGPNSLKSHTKPFTTKKGET